MNFDTYTERAQSVLQAAQTAALANSNQLFLPEHILAAMLEDRDQLAINLIRAAGGQQLTVGREGSLDNRRLVSCERAAGLHRFGVPESHD